MCQVRLDIYVKNKMKISRQKAQELISSRQVGVNGKIVDKPSYKTEDKDIVEIGSTDNILKYVSRGGYKLEKACHCFSVDLRDKICIDIGASTGGFTHCMLTMGAKKVYSVDVGTNQLAESLKNDNRVVSFENTDIRLADIENADFISCDVSFISLKMILPHIKRLLKTDGQAVVLIKPQFEAGRENINKKGIVKNSAIHKRVLKEIVDACKNLGFYVNSLTFSPIKGGDGNIEYLALLSYLGACADKFVIDNVVNEAFINLKK